MNRKATPHPRVTREGAAPEKRRRFEGARRDDDSGRPQADLAAVTPDRQDASGSATLHQHPLHAKAGGDCGTFLAGGGQRVQVDSRLGVVRATDRALARPPAAGSVAPKGTGLPPQCSCAGQRKLSFRPITSIGTGATPSIASTSPRRSSNPSPARASPASRQIFTTGAGGR